MLLRTKMAFLVAMSVAGQTGAVGGYAYLEMQRRETGRQTRQLRLHLGRLRDFHDGLKQISDLAPAAVATGRTQTLRALYERSAVQSGFLNEMRIYPESRSLNYHWESYLAAWAPLLQTGKGFSVLKETEGPVFREWREFAKSLGERLARAEELGERRAAQILDGVGLALGFLSLFMIGCAVWWLRDLRRALAAVQQALDALARGQLPQESEVAGKDELGRLLAAARRVAKQSIEMRQTMIRWDRLAAMGQVAGGVAHEINNPLVGVLGQAELLGARLGQDHPAKAHVGKILEAAQRARKIVRNLLDFSRPRDAEFAPADLTGIIESVLDIVGSDFEKAAIKIEKSISKDLPTLECRSGDLAEVFLNLFVNAKDAMRQGGTLFVRARHEAPDLVVEVEDTGSGILPEDLPHLFEAFFTTKEPGRGTGLGLAVSYGVIQNHGGSIEAHSDGFGKGSKFRVKLPLKRE